MVESSNMPILSKENMTIKLERLMKDYGLSKVCYEAVIYHFLNYPPDMQKIAELIEPITIINEPGGTINIKVTEGVTQSDLEEFVNLNYSKVTKQEKKRLNIKSGLQEALIVHQRINKDKTYKEIQQEIDERYGEWKEDSNLRTIIAKYNQRIK